MTLNAKKINPIFGESELSLLQSFNEKQLELTESFVENIDKHIGYYTKEQFYQTHADDEGEMIEVEVPHINGISENEFDIKGLFSQSLPMYQRQSMLVTNWAIFENELKDFLNYMAKELNKKNKLPKKEKKDSDLNHLIKSFKAIDLLKNNSTEFQLAFNKLNYETRFLRIDWVHNGGYPVKTTERTKGVGKINGIKLVDGKMDISAEYLRQVIEWMLVLRRELFYSTLSVLRSNK